MSFSTYGDLQTAIGTWLNRTDMTDAITTDLISLAEARLKRDKRLRQLVVATINPAADDYALPDRFAELTSLYYNDSGNGRYGPLRIVDPDQIGEMRAYYGNTGPPVAAAVVAVEGANVLRFAPVPSSAVTMKLEYVARLDPIDDTTNTSNSILENHPDIYLYACLVEAAPFLMEDERVPLWEAKLQNALNEYHRDVQRREFGGHLVARPSQTIGGDL